MEFELHPSFIVPSGTFSILIAPDKLLLAALEKVLPEAGLRVLYICGNYSLLLSRLDRQCSDFHVRRAFTVFQLLSILEEADQALIVVEHDRSLYDDAPDLIGYVALACADRAQVSSVAMLASTFDPVLQTMCGRADRVAYFEKQVPVRISGITEVPADQSTLKCLMKRGKRHVDF
jgi:hypothetical protein